MARAPLAWHAFLTEFTLFPLFRAGREVLSIRLSLGLEISPFQGVLQMGEIRYRAVVTVAPAYFGTRLAHP